VNSSLRLRDVEFNDNKNEREASLTDKVVVEANFQRHLCEVVIASLLLLSGIKWEKRGITHDTTART
jgi:hypothetical protein